MRQISTFSASGTDQSPAVDYARSPLRQVTGDCLRPGGPALTAHGLDLCAFAPGSLVLDLACGAGASLGLLRERGCRALGLDISPLLLTEASGNSGGAPCLLADMAALPLRDACLDGILCECALSLADDPARVLAECARCLKPGGRLLLCDLVRRGPREADGTSDPGGRSISGKISCAAGQAASFACAAGALFPDALVALVPAAGLAPLAYEDHDDALKHLAARLVWHFGSLAAVSELWHTHQKPAPQACGRDAAKLGYILLIAQKTE